MQKTPLKIGLAVIIVVAILILSWAVGPYLLDNFFPLFLTYQYWALFLICFLAAMALPLPSNTSVTIMSIFAAIDYLNFSLVLVVALVGYVLGDWVGFWLARLFGPRVLQWTGFKRIAEYRYFVEAERYVNDHPALTIFLSRFVSAAGPAVNILAGLSKISFRKFLAFELPGEALDVLIFALGGYFFGEQFQNYGSTITLIELAIVAIIILAYWAIRRHKRK
ncbi:MAG: DedA family protein [Candidatus Paceibacterota bacterium]|jgi:membrane protein DedA with SNARE-associated domain